MNKYLIVLLLCIVSLQAKSQPQFAKFYPDSLVKKRLYTTIGLQATTYVAGLYFLNNIWYEDHERVDFHYYDDSKGYLQVDKYGHAYGAYRQSYASYYALRWAGMDKKNALIFGGPAGLLFQTPIEIFDGLYEGYGFSWSDMAANTAGAALFTVQEAFWDEQIVLMKFSYSPSEYRELHPVLGETHIESFFLDYNAHTYWLSGNIRRLTGLQVPEWLCLAVGYSANGMIFEFDNPRFFRGEPFPQLDRYRQYLISLDIDLTKIRTNRPWLAKLFRAMNLIKIPFPAIEINRVNGVEFRPFYF